MSPYESALLIQRYAAEAIEGLRTQGATADTESRLVDISALARDIATVLRPVVLPAERPAISKARIATAQRKAVPGIAEIKETESNSEPESKSGAESSEPVES